MTTRTIPPCHHKQTSDGCFACWKWATDAGYRAMWSREPSNRVTLTPPPANGPGTELERLLMSMGFAKGASCGCEFFKAWMNRLGVEGCREKRDIIIAQLRDQANRTQTSFGKKLIAALKTDIWSVADLVDEAIRRANQP